MEQSCKCRYLLSSSSLAPGYYWIFLSVRGVRWAMSYPDLLNARLRQVGVWERKRHLWKGVRMGSSQRGQSGWPVLRRVQICSSRCSLTDVIAFYPVFEDFSYGNSCWSQGRRGPWWAGVVGGSVGVSPACPLSRSAQEPGQDSAWDTAPQKPTLSCLLNWHDTTLGSKHIFFWAKMIFYYLPYFPPLDYIGNRGKIFSPTQNPFQNARAPHQAVVDPPQRLQDPCSVCQMCSSTQRTHPLYSTALESWRVFFLLQVDVQFAWMCPNKLADLAQLA